MILKNYNLRFLFNNYSVNKKGAKFVFSTHNVEILDYLSRRDEIFITHKYNGKIDAKSLYLDFEVRTELLNEYVKKRGKFIKINLACEILLN